MIFSLFFQSDPTFVPIKFPERNQGNSGTESDDSSVNRSVRFSKLAEVCFYYSLIYIILLGKKVVEFLKNGKLGYPCRLFDYVKPLLSSTGIFMYKTI